MNVLSIVWTACSTAAVMIDGEVVACASEERFSRIKNDERYPRQAIDAVLRDAGLSPSQLDVVVFATESFDPESILVHRYSGFTVADRIREQQAYWYPRMYLGKPVSFLEVFKDRIDTDQDGGSWDEVMALARDGTAQQKEEAGRRFRQETVRRHLGVEASRVGFVTHHRAHGYYAYYGSPLREPPVLILTADAWGDGANATISVADSGGITELSRSSNYQGARLYRSMTLLLGMKPDEHEYKVMGLAGYADPEETQRAYEVFAATQYVEGLGFAYRTTPPDLYVYFRDRLEGCRFDAIAGALQRYTEEVLVGWAQNALRATGARRVVFAGGVGMNVKALMRIAKLPEVDLLFVCPTPSDESTAIGSAYAALHDRLLADGRCPATVLKPLPHAYLGSAASRAELRQVRQRFARHLGYRVREDVDGAYVAAQLAAGKLVGRCVGRSEFGARALGNRSILADPRQPGVARRINEGVKNRDFWMPFAPTMLAERADDYLVGRKGMPAPYMTLAFDTSEQGRRDLPAALHQGDLTCRPQILERRHNPGFAGLITAFEQRTGVGGLLNTSFNLHGEPIVQTPADAARVFERSGLDVLILDDCMIEKRPASPTAGAAMDERQAATATPVEAAACS